VLLVGWRAHAAAAPPQAEQPAAWTGLAERGWFGLAAREAQTDVDRRRVAALAQAVQADRCRQSAWLAEAVGWRVLWNRAAVGTPAVESGGRIAWAGPRGLALAEADTGVPSWGSDADDRQPLFPRQAGVRETELARPPQVGPVAAAASRLFGVMALPSRAAPAGLTMVACDLADAAEGRLLWLAEVSASANSPEAVALAADAADCVVVLAAADAAAAEVVVRGSVAGDVRWRSRVAQSLARTIPEAVQRPVVAICQHLVVVVLPSGQLVGLDRTTGQCIWQQSELASPAATAPGTIDALADGGDRLLVLYRPAAGLPEIIALDLSDGSLLGRTRLSLAAFAAKPGEPAEPARIGPATVVGGHAVWPVGATDEAALQQLLLAPLVPERPLPGQQAAAVTISAKLVPVDAAAQRAGQPVPESEPPQARRLAVVAGGRLWCLAPLEAAGADIAPVP
jgi:hypothetical protein